MAIKTDAELKVYFETGKTPTEAQYQDLIDTLRNAGVPVPQDEVEKAAPYTLTMSGSGVTYALPTATLLRDVIIDCTGSGTLTIGTTGGGTELYSGDVVSGEVYEINLTKYFKLATTIYFGGDCSANIRLYVQ